MLLFRSATADGGGISSGDSAAETPVSDSPAESPALSNDFAQNWDGHGPAQSVPSKDTEPEEKSSAFTESDQDEEHSTAEFETGSRGAAEEDLSEWAPIIEQLRQEGFESPDDVHAALETQQQDAQIRSHLDPVAMTLAQRVDAGEIAWEDAELLWEAEKLRVGAGLDRAMYAEWRAGQELEQARHHYPGMDPEFVAAVHKATGQPIAAIARASHEYRQTIEAEAIARYQAHKAATAAYPAPEGATGHAPTTAPTGGKPFLQSYRDLFGIGRTG